MKARAGGVIVSVVAVVGASLGLLAAPAGAVATPVNDETSLRTAFATDAEVSLQNDIVLSTCTAGDDAVVRSGNDPVVVEGNGFTVTQTCPGDIVLEDTGSGQVTLRNLTLASPSGGVSAAGAVVGEQLVVSGTTSTTGTVVGVKGVSVSLTDSEVHGYNTDGAVYGVQAGAGSVELSSSRVYGIRAAGVIFAVSSGGGVSLTDSLVRDVVSTGGAVLLLTSDSGVIRMVRSTLADATGAAGAIGVNGKAEVVNSTITGMAGLAINAVQATVVYSDIVGNGKLGVNFGSVEGLAVTPSATGWEFQVLANQLTTFGSVIAHANDGLPNCAVLASSSAGYNFADDTSCALTATGDRQGAGLDPQLGALAGNGGPTPTFLPQTGSPLLEAIPAAACQSGPAAGVTVDQRGEPRPGFTNCDIGSVELQPAPVVIQPTFTG